MIDAYTKIPDAPLDPPEDRRPIVYYCDECGTELRKYDEFYTLAGLHFCPDCVECAHGYVEEAE